MTQFKGRMISINAFGSKGIALLRVKVDLKLYFLPFLLARNDLALHFLHLSGLCPGDARMVALHFMQTQTFLKILFSASANLAIREMI
jgi:hypothetical protein